MTELSSLFGPTFFPIVVFAFATLSVAGVTAAVFYPRLAQPSSFKRRFQGLATADAEAGAAPSADEERDRRRSVEKTLRELEEKQKAKSRKAGKPTLSGRIRQAGLSWSTKRYYIACAVSGAASLLLAFVSGAGMLVSLGFAVAGGLLLPHLYVGMLRKRRFKGFTAEFPNAIDVIVRGLKSGLPMGDCLRVIATEAQEPVRSEFVSIVQDQTLGIPLDEAVQRLWERVPLPEANFFAIVIALQSRTGGSLSEALGNLSKVLRERKKMSAKIKAMSSEAKSSAGIIGALPFLVSAAVYVTSPDYMSLLFTTLTGKLVLVGCALWMGMGILVMRKMINFDF
ncbi:type II secretion system F family protein [Nitratireductor sp. ZSWI3]|uniref:type II secretion system F family protein n=1 Tax=Nitratireductor sp. ZSWI3 TaxID=2966359 RepID=UPI0021504921|nr:type II secretion system F family protein [Nitratireductor sp. ZSWI3]MCR4264729.1 type II secretion system F family protein [Nitratireductor sp. ZSWI3]